MRISEQLLRPYASVFQRAGDALPRQFEGRLIGVRPPGIIIARPGGEAFAALIDTNGFTLKNAVYPA